MRYIINGGKQLIGKIQSSGNKNAVFPSMAAALLSQEEVILENVPDIKDTEVLIEIIKKLGVSVSKKDSVVRINAKNLKHSNLPKELVTKLRGSIVLVGSLLGRLGRVTFHHPGGDIIGKRSIEIHLEGFKALKVDLERNDLKYSLSCLEDTRETNFFLPEASVTAAQNLILFSALGKRVVTLKNCPREPQIVDLCNLLIQMGAKISGTGTDTLVICGVEKLSGTKFRLGIDYIELGTYAIAACVTGGRITVAGLDSTDLEPVLFPLTRFGVEVQRNGSEMTFAAGKLRSVPKLITNIWPGFPTDMMSAAIVLATQSKGVTLCHDWMYESRMFFVDKLITMGANITLADPHRVFVYGPTRLRGRELDTPDIRAGMALVLAALLARGRSIIHRAELIERGYEDVVSKLRSLGAEIERRED